MQGLEKVFNQVEQGIANHTTSILHEFVRDLQSLEHFGVSQKQITAELNALNNKLHHDGLLPDMNIVGFEKGDHGSLIVNARQSHDLSAFGKPHTEAHHVPHAEAHRPEAPPERETHLPVDLQPRPGHHGPTLTQWAADSLGWTKSKSNPNEFYMQGNHGELFKYEKQQNDFIQVNDNGQPVDAHGHRVQDSKALHLKPGDTEHQGADTMYAHSRVEPASGKFSNPEQMFATAMESFRGDQYHRASLRNESPALYIACKLEDQKEVDALFGPGKKIRDFNGSLVDNTRAQRQHIKDLEQLYKSAPPACPDRTIYPPDQI
jgi:hypothetical protein